MEPNRVEDFPLFPLGMVALPSEQVPLHIFEQRYRTMINVCIDEEREFGIVLMADDGLREIGCACVVDRVLERLDDGRINIIARGTRAIRVLERQSHLPYPAAVVEFVSDREEAVEAEPRDQAHAAYTELVKQATGRDPDAAGVAEMSAYGMAATVEFGVDAKQGLLDLRSENARLRFVTRLFRGALKRLDFADRAETRARSNGTVRFG